MRVSMRLWGPSGFMQRAAGVRRALARGRRVDQQGRPAEIADADAGVRRVRSRHAGVAVEVVARRSEDA